MSKPNIIKRNCPNDNCKGDEADVLGAVIKNKESFTYYKCLTCNQNYLIPRKGDKKEQRLVEKYIKASAIILK